MTETDRDAPEDRPRRVLLAVHTGRADIVALARSAAGRLTSDGIIVPSSLSQESATAATVVPSQRSSPVRAAPAARWLSRNASTGA